MGTSGTHEWQGEQEVYEFTVYEKRGGLPESPGVYIYAVSTLQGGWAVLYVGQTNNLKRQAQEHEFKYATHIHFYAESDSDRQDEIEEDLISALNPPENQTPS